MIFGHFYSMKPFSKNIIFVDTEFSDLNPYKGEILSIGLVKLNGKSLYLELEYNGEVSDWVKKNTLPTLTKRKLSREEAKKKIKKFVGNKKPFMISYVDNFDSIYLYKLFNIKEFPFHWIPIDFASIMFGAGINPENYHDNKMKFIRQLGINPKKYKQHNALDDAKLLREVYLKFFKKL